MVAVPASLAGALFVSLALTEGLSLAYRLSAFAVSFITSELVCPLSLWSRKRLKVRHLTRQRRAPQISSLIRTFQGPYRAFFHKDLRELRTWTGVFLIVCLVMVGLGVMLFARITQDWRSFTVCFSVALILAVGMLPSTLFECEIKPYRDYYTRQLRLKDEQIVAYKLPLQILIVVAFALVLVLYDGFIHGFVASYLLIALGITAYYAVLCAPISWWCVRRLKKGKGFNSLYLLASLAVFAVPGAMPAYALASLLVMRSAHGLQMRRSRHA
jgi:hypothetical protein